MRVDNLDKDQALQSFWSRFGLKAYDETTVPDDAMEKNGGAYITYNSASSDLDDPIPLYGNLWYLDKSWANISRKADQIERYIGLGGVLVPYDGGQIWIKRGVPFRQRMADDNSNIRRIYINLMVEFQQDY